MKKPLKDMARAQMERSVAAAEPKQTEPEVLVFGVEKEIFALDVTLPSPELKKIAERRWWVKSLCYHDGKLYDGVGVAPELNNYRGVIYETLADRDLAERDGFVHALCSHKGRLYDSGNYGICETFNGVQLMENPKEAIYSLFSIGGELLFIDGDLNGVSSINSSTYINDKGVLCVCEYKGKVYYATTNSIIDKETGTGIVLPDRCINAFSVCNNLLYDISFVRVPKKHHTIDEFFTGRQLFESEKAIEGLCSAPRKLLAGVLK